MLAQTGVTDTFVETGVADESGSVEPDGALHLRKLLCVRYCDHTRMVTTHRSTTISCQFVLSSSSSTQPQVCAPRRALPFSDSVYMHATKDLLSFPFNEFDFFLNASTIYLLSALVKESATNVH